MWVFCRITKLNIPAQFSFYGWTTHTFIFWILLVVGLKQGCTLRSGAPARKHTHRPAPVCSLEYPLPVGCAHQRQQCLLCVWRQTVINWEHPSGTSADWHSQSAATTGMSAGSLYANSSVLQGVFDVYEKMFLWICFLPFAVETFSFCQQCRV